MPLEFEEFNVVEMLFNDVFKIVLKIIMAGILIYITTDRLIQHSKEEVGLTYSKGENVELPSFTICHYEHKRYKIVPTNLTFEEYMNQTLDVKDIIVKALYFYGSESENRE